MSDCWDDCPALWGDADGFVVVGDAREEVCIPCLRGAEVSLVFCSVLGVFWEALVLLEVMLTMTLCIIFPICDDLLHIALTEAFAIQ
jgi:hypothetical protein